MRKIYVLVLSAVSLFSEVGFAQSSPLIDWNASSQGPPVGWSTQFHPDIPAHTAFAWKQIDASWGLDVQSSAGHGSMVYRFEKPTSAKNLGWQWQVQQKPVGADLRHKSTDDSAAKVCLFIQIDESKLGLGTRLKLGAARTLSGQDLPAATLCYQWAENVAPGVVFANPYTDRVVNYVLENRPASDLWKPESRALKADAIKAFGKELPDDVRDGDADIRLLGIAVGADADNTKGKTQAVIKSLRLD